jgi:drug/metabolite transporter (DMT)-like permease
LSPSGARAGLVLGLLFQAIVSGINFLLIRIAVRDLDPLLITCARSFLGFPLLIGAAYALDARPSRAIARPLVVHGTILGALNVAAPYVLLTWGERHIDAGVAAIAASSMPIFAALVAIRFLPSERLRPIGFAGLALGLVGVGVLTGVAPAGGGLAVLGTLAAVGAAFLWGATSIYIQLQVRAIPAPLLVAVAVGIAGILLVPAAIPGWPSEAPAAGPLAAMIGLGLISATLQFNFFRLITLYGSSRTNLVGYLTPPAALAMGAIFLDEKIRPGAVAGLVLILAGVVLSTRGMRPRALPREA